MHDTQRTDKNNHNRPLAIGTCPVCHDRHIAFEPAGTSRGRQMAICGACGSIVALPKVQGGDGPTEPDRDARWAATDEADRDRQNRSYAEVDEDDDPAVRLLEAIRTDATQLLDLLDDLDDSAYSGEVQTELESISERLTLIIEGTVDTLRGRHVR